MRRSFLVPVLLAAAFLVLIVTGQAGLSAHDLTTGLTHVTELQRTYGWPLIVLASLAVWLQARDRGAGFYALGLSYSVVIGLTKFIPLWAVSVWFPVYSIGLTLAAIAWADPDPGARRRLTTLLAGPVAIVAAASWLYLLTARLTGATAPLAATLTAVYAAFWFLLAGVAWWGRQKQGARPLLWLGAHAALLGLNSLMTAADIFRPTLLRPPLGLLSYEILVVLTVIAAIGTVWSASVTPRGIPGS